MDEVAVIGLVMVLTEIIKVGLIRWLGDDLGKRFLPVVVLVLAGGLNTVAALLLTPAVPWREAMIAGLKLGAMTSGIYGLGKAALGRS